MAFGASRRRVATPYLAAVWLVVGALRCLCQLRLDTRNACRGPHAGAGWRWQAFGG